MKRFRLFDDILGNMNANRSPLEFLIVAAAAIAVIFIYTAALPGPFVFDDESNITENRHIRIKSLGFDELYAAAFKSPIPNRPVANLSLALNYYFNGYNVVGYRFANILIHILNGFLLYGLARATFRTPAMAGLVVRPEMAAAFAALVWMVHPLHTQSVAYIVQRMTSLSVMFYLTALLCYAKARLESSGGRRAATGGAAARVRYQGDRPGVRGPRRGVPWAWRRRCDWHDRDGVRWPCGAGRRRGEARRPG